MSMSYKLGVKRITRLTNLSITAVGKVDIECLRAAGFR